MGALLRYAFVDEISWIKYRNLLHGHSHVAMLGWLYLGLIALLIHQFLPKEQINVQAYSRLFWLTQLSVAGMLISFPIQGYGAFSITFSTLHILCSYVFLFWFWRDLGKTSFFSHLLVKAALVFMALSTLGVWMMGPIMAMNLRGSSLYYMAVQFYLHFQFNGWFLFAALALLFQNVESQSIFYSKRLANWFVTLLILATILTYALAIAWSQPELYVFIVNGVGVFVQLLALVCFLGLVWKARNRFLVGYTKEQRLLIKIAFLSFAAKVIVQSSVVLPFVAKAAYTIRNYVIGFIHLILLGTISSFILAIAFKNKQLDNEKMLSRVGVYLLLSGFILSEFILFLQGTMFWGAKGFLPAYYELLFGVSLLMPLGIGILWVGQLKNKEWTISY
ncbi:MAG: hypothetical protein Sapg2KO_49630 [Saprospiraceae bacterium]